MSNPSVVWLQLPAAVTNGVCLAQTPTAAGALTLNGSLVTAGVATVNGGVLGSGTPAQRIGIHSTSNSDTGLIFTVIGTDRNGNVISEAITGVTTTTVKSAYDYATITAVSVSAAAVGNIIVGTIAYGSTDWVLDDFLVTPFELSLACTLNSGSATFSVERTYDDPNKLSTGTSLVAGAQQFSMEAASFVPPAVWVVPEINAATGSVEANMSARPCFAHRLTITAGTGQVVMQSIQAGTPRI